MIHKYDTQKLYLLNKNILNYRWLQTHLKYGTNTSEVNSVTIQHWHNFNDLE